MCSACPLQSRVRPVTRPEPTTSYDGRVCHATTTIPHRRPRRGARRPARTARAHALAGAAAGRAVGAWREHRVHPRAVRVLARWLRLAEAGSGAERVPAVRQHDRWRRHPLLACARQGRVTDAADARAWLARLDLRVPPPHRSADRSGGARRRCGGRLRCRHPGAARLRVQRQADRAGLGSRAHGCRLRSADDGRTRLSPATGRRAAIGARR